MVRCKGKVYPPPPPGSGFPAESGTRRQGSGALAVGILLLALAGCEPLGDGFNAEDWDWMGEGGMVNVRINLNSAGRFVLPTDAPGKEAVTYFEAFFRQQGTAPTQYYTGAASRGESYIVVSVVPEKKYDILILAGVLANGQSGNGERVLLASGWLPDYEVRYGRNIASVPMKLHATTDALGYSAAEEFTYTPVISNVGSLAAAEGGSVMSIAGAEARLKPYYPDPYAGLSYSPPVTTAFAGASLTLTITAPMPAEVKTGEVFYQCWYNLTYYAFGDPASRSSRWNIRRGVLEEPYLLTYYGGGIPLTPCYYVSANGSDANDGIAKEKPFKTLGKAVSAVRKKTIPWIKTIAVLGELNGASEGSATYPGYWDNNSVFAINNPQTGESAVDLIRITGDPALTGGGAAALSGVAGKWVASITGNTSKILLDHITVTGSSGGAGGGIRVQSGAELTLREGAFITENVNSGYRNNNSAGGGVQVNNAKLVMYDGEISHNVMSSTGSNAYAGVGAGVFITNAGVFEMSGGVIVDNTAQFAVGVYVFNGVFRMSGGLISHNTADGGTPGGGAGVEISNSGLFEMSGGEIGGNIGNQHLGGSDASSGGGGVWNGGTFNMSGTARITNNYSHFRGGGVCVSGAFNLDTTGGAYISGNNANGNGDQVYRAGGTFRLNTVPQTSTNVFNNPIP